MRSDVLMLVFATGVLVKYGGMTVQDGGGYITNMFGGAPVLMLTAGDTTQFTDSVLRMVSKR
jgi:hypothetical protein